MTEELDAVIFDFGGTLVDLSPPREAVFHKVLTARGFEVSVEEIARMIGKAERKYDELQAGLDGEHEEAFWDMFDLYVLKGLGFEGDAEAFSADLSREFDAIVPKVESWVEYPDARPLLNDIRERALRLGLVSNATDLARRVLDHLGLTELFDSIVISSEVGVRKPDRRIFSIASEMLNTQPNRALYVGDKLTVDVRGAKSAGMNAVLIDRAGVYADVDCLKIRTLDSLRRFL